jgi:hypothetical protein
MPDEATPSVEDLLQETMAEVEESNSEEPSEAPAAQEEEPPKEEPPKEEPQPDPDAEFGRNLREGLAKAPAQVLRALAERLGVSEDLAREMGWSAAQPAPSDDEQFDIKTYEPQGDMERALAKKWSWVADGQEAVAEAFQRHASLIDDLYLQTLEQKAVIKALADLGGVTVPSVDRNALYEALQGGGVTPEQAVEKLLGAKLQEAVRVAKQKSKQRPSTPLQGSGDQVPAGKSTSTKIDDLLQETLDELGLSL